MRKTYVIDYGCGCTMGRVRKNNEDNFYCAGEIRMDPDSTEEVFHSGTFTSKDNETMAVFDGMGGEACGEVASYLAASTCQQFLKNKAHYNDYLYELSVMLNDRVVAETKARSVVLMGSTAAMMQFNRKEIYILNSGDSRIYKFTNGELTQLSKDQVAKGYKGKSPLTNFLGVPPEKRDFVPYIARGDYRNEDIFVMCTDGVTDMIGEENLARLISEKTDLMTITKNIIEMAKEYGGVDNATVIVCKIR